MGQFQYISDENNTVTSVIIPIDLWQTIEAERNRFSNNRKKHAAKKSGNSKIQGSDKKKPRNFGRMGSKVKIIGDIIAPVCDAKEWEVLGI